MLAGLACILFFSIRAIRMRWYEVFLVMHIIGEGSGSLNF